MKIVKQLTELIGNTPLLELTNYEKEQELKAKIVVKLEYFNPLGSVKDRVANAMIEQGIKDGKINQDTIIIEPTSGNTGIGLAFVCAAKGLHLILTMPDTMSVERRKIVGALGAEIVLTPGRDGMKGAIAKAESLKEEYGNAFIPQQFENAANPAIHKATTAQEIWNRRTGRHLRISRRYRRNRNRNRTWAEREKSGCEGGCSRACKFSGSFRRKAWSA